MADSGEKGRNICSLDVILGVTVVLIVLAATVSVCVQCGSLFVSGTRDAGMEVDILMQEVDDFKKELSSELLSLREEFQGDLSRLRESVDREVDTSHEVLSILNDTSKKIAKDPTEFYDVIKTGKIDFALESLGGSIVSTRDTKDYEKTRFGTHSVQNIIQPCVMPGQCWAFEGSGAVVIQLVGKVNVTSVSMEHASRAQLTAGLIRSAPKDFSVWGLDSLHDEGHSLGNFTYDIYGSPLQYFPIQDTTANSFNLIELKIHSNNGNPYYTCLYRFRVHGTTTINEQAQTSSN
jgi:SUN domain-containing protein 1/2